MRYIPLPDGDNAIIDEEDYQEMSTSRWRKAKNGRVVRTVQCGKKAKTIYLHRAIMEPCEGFFVQHINGDFLDNRKENLRLVTQWENTKHRTRAAGKSTSRFRGVSLVKKGKYQYWRAQIFRNGKQTSLGYFSSEEEAANAYKNAIQKNRDSL